MTALLRAELLKLRTTRTFAAVVASAAALSLTLVVLGAALGKETKAHALFTNSAITYIIVILGAIAMTGEWRHRTITGSVLAAPNRARLLAAKAIFYSVAGITLAILVTVPTIIVGELVLSGRGLATLHRRRAVAQPGRRCPARPPRRVRRRAGTQSGRHRRRARHHRRGD